MTDRASATAVSPLQQFGYVRVYRAVQKTCGVPAAYLYGVLEDYVQLGARTGRGCVPSHKHLAETMGVSLRSVVTYLHILRDKGWVTWEEDNNGTVNSYRLPSRKIYTPPVQDLHIPYADSAHNQEQETKNNVAISDTPYPLAPSERTQYPQDFEDFWKSYGPTNGPKKQAYNAWKVLGKEKQALALKHLPAWLESEQWQSGYKVYPQKYLNSGLYQQVPVEVPKSSKTNGVRDVRPEERRPAIKPYEFPTEVKTMSNGNLTRLRGLRGEA